MKNEKNITKQKILNIALELFSQRGYGAVSIRDIGKIVGIKESTIYYHFKNKQDILDVLLLEIKEITSQMADQFNDKFETITRVEETEFVQVGLGILKGYLLNPRMNRFIQMLMIEQYSNKEAARLFREILFDAPLKQNEEVFEKMIARGYFKQEEAKLLGAEYYSLIYFIFQKYFNGNVITSNEKKQAIKELSIHIQRFYRRYSK